MMRWLGNVDMNSEREQTTAGFAGAVQVGLGRSF